MSIKFRSSVTKYSLALPILFPRVQQRQESLYRPSNLPINITIIDGVKFTLKIDFSNNNFNATKKLHEKA